MQAALPCMLFARGPTRLQLRGGTNAAFAPTIDYFMRVRTHDTLHCDIDTYIALCLM